MNVKNIDIKVNGNKLTISVDLTKVFGLSKSGKTTIIAGTEGNQKIEGTEAYFGLTVYKK